MPEAEGTAHVAGLFVYAVDLVYCVGQGSQVSAITAAKVSEDGSVLSWQLATHKVSSTVSSSSQACCTSGRVQVQVLGCITSPRFLAYNCKECFCHACFAHALGAWQHCLCHLSSHIRSHASSRKLSSTAVCRLNRLGPNPRKATAAAGASLCHLEAGPLVSSGMVLSLGGCPKAWRTDKNVLRAAG